MESTCREHIHECHKYEMHVVWDRVGREGGRQAGESGKVKRPSVAARKAKALGKTVAARENPKTAEKRRKYSRKG